MAEAPWSEVERRWRKVQIVEGVMVEQANDALAKSAEAGSGSPLQIQLRARSVALHDAAALLRTAMDD